MKNTKQLFTILLLIISISFVNANVHFETISSIGAENSFGGADDFVTTWKTDNSGASNNTSIIIPTTGTGYNYDVDWNNDGVFDEFGITGDATHNYGLIGTYTIRIQGDFPRIYFNDDGDKEKIISIDQWGNQQWASMDSAFQGCSNLVGQATDIPDLTNTTSLVRMFGSATIFNQNINNWDTSNITNMSGIFSSSSFNQPLNNWNTLNVTDMSFLFASTPFNQDISDWNTSNVTTMFYMFFSTSDFNQNINNWNVSNVTNMAGMFHIANAFSQPINSWNTSNVTNMSNMFNLAINFDQPIGNWNTGNVTNMFFMFWRAEAFNQPIGKWHTINVNNMSGMFINAFGFNQPIGDWDTSSVTTMTNMFLNAVNFNQNIGNWNISNLIDATDMFSGVTLSTENYDALLIGWEAQPHNNIIPFSGGNSNYCLGETARANLINDGWTITDAGLDCTVSVEDQIVNNIEVYPNPSKDGIFNLIWNNESKITIKVVDITGKVTIPSTEINYSTNYHLDLSSFASGVYFVEFIANDKRAIKKLLLFR